MVEIGRRCEGCSNEITDEIGIYNIDVEILTERFCSCCDGEMKVIDVVFISKQKEM